MKKWILKRNKVNTAKMAEALQIEEAIACILANRGIGTYSAGIRFLKSDLDSLYSAQGLKDLEKGVALLLQGIDENKKIAVYGDYDVDGVMSTTILYKALKFCGADVLYYIPHRQKEGYGLNMDAVIELAALGVDILLTTDNGITALKEVEKAKELSMTVIIVDHHEPLFEQIKEEKIDLLPIADAVIDPKQKKCKYPFDKLCAGGLAYKLACVLLEKKNINEEELKKQFLVLSAIATVCDIVDLLDENRILVKNGLRYIKESGNIGLNALIEETELLEKEITAYHIGFMIGPCINATGRLESAKLSIELFTQENKETARLLAKKLVQLNNSRKAMTIEAEEKIVETIESGSYQEDKVFVLYQEDIHESIAGIVAGRIKEKYYHPVIVITKSEDMAKGSARSIEAYNMFEGLCQCRELFSKFGGHPMAAGLSLPYENINLLRKMLNKNCTLEENDFIQELKIEKQLPIGKITMSLAEKLQTLAPFGKANPTPLFGDKNVFVEKIDFIGKNKNIIRFLFYDKVTGHTLTGISFDGYESFINQTKNLYENENYDKIINNNCSGILLDIVFGIEINVYNGRSKVQLMIQDFRYSK